MRCATFGSRGVENDEVEWAWTSRARLRVPVDDAGRRGASFTGGMEMGLFDYSPWIPNSSSLLHPTVSLNSPITSILTS